MKTPDELMAESPGVIHTYGGGAIDLIHPSPEDVSIEAIAHALSMQCRWTGHVKRFYSVAEHSYHVSKIVPRLEALLHDAAEAYLGDMASPLKRTEEVGRAYSLAETRMELQIVWKFRLSWPWSKAIKEADTAMLLREAQELLPHLGEKMPDPPEGTPPVWCWTPQHAEEKFLERYYSLEAKR